MKRAATTLSIAMILVVAAPVGARIRIAAWWPFYEGTGTVAHDLSGNRNNGTISGGASWVSGYFGRALSFDGATAQVDVPDSASLEPSDRITVTAYVKAAGSPGAFKYVVAKGAAACNAASYRLYTGPNGGLTFYVSQNSGLTYTRSPDAGNSVWDGDWHFVVGTYDGASVHLYVDGRQIGSGTPRTGSIGYGLSSGNHLFIGHYDGCPGLDFAGSVDEPIVWDAARSPGEVHEGYEALTFIHRIHEQPFFVQGFVRHRKRVAPR